MRRRNLAFIALFLSTSFCLAQESIQPSKVIYPTKMTASEPLRDLVRPIPEFDPGIPARQNPNHPPKFTGSQASGPSSHDPVHQSGQGAKPAGPTLINWAGLSVHENPFHVEPGDPSLAVGPNDDLVQMVNAIFYIADKTNTWKIPPSLNSDFWIGFGGPCEFNNDGDPNVLYDPLADRWLMSQHVFSQKQCIAISQTSDPTGAYFLYEFDTPGNDNPKFGVWSDGYYVGMRNLTSGEYDVYVFERDEMLAGNPNAQAVSFDLETLLPGADNFLPADIDGTTPPPAGAPGIFLGMENPSILQSHLALFELNMDWNNTVNSTLTGPTNIPVSQFDGSLCNFSRDCIPQPNTSQRLDALSGTMMHRVVYRNFGTHQSIVANHTVDLGDFNNHAAIRWYEFRNTGSGWSVHQEGTYSPDSDHRWNGSIAMNGNGDIMMGYTVTSRTTFPAIRYTGRQAGDPLGQMTLSETLLISGLDSQVGTNRWGDYSATVVDPADDFSFWHNNYWIEGPNDDWHTWIAKFQATTAPPLVDLTVSPSPGNPVFVAPQGQSTFFTYDVTVNNNDTSTLNTQIWNTITLGIGEEIGPVQLTPQSISVPAGGSFNQTFAFEFPPVPPPGTYVLNMKVGTFPNVQLDRDTFSMVRTTSPSFTKTGTGGIEDWLPGSVLAEAAVPEEFVLEPNYPNPFNPSTVIRYGLSEDTHVKLTIYNTLGQEVTTLVDEVQNTGFQTVSWNGTDNLGQQVSAGVYVYRLEAGNNVQIKKMALTK